MRILRCSSVRGSASGFAGRTTLALFALGLCRCGNSFDLSPADASPGGSEKGPGEAGSYVIAVPDAGARDVGADVADADAADVAICDPTKDPKDEPCLVDDAFGVFVAAVPEGKGGSSPDAALDATAADAEPDAAAAGGTAGDGSMAHPFPTIAQALASAASRSLTRIYVCNGAYVESVGVTSAVGIYGGFSCAADAGTPTWRWVGGTATVTAPSMASTSPVYALSVRAPTGTAVVVEDMTFVAPDATGTDARGNGASSVAAFVDGSAVAFTRVALRAGKGAAGADGVSGVRDADGTIVPNFVGANSPAASAVGPGAITCSFIDVANGATLPDSSSGGEAGAAYNNMIAGVIQESGTPGTSNPVTVYVAGISEAGANGAGGALGVAGSMGNFGSARPGGIASTTAGSLGSAGWVPSAGGDGAAGQPGQGGGGGGGSDSQLGLLPGGAGGAGSCGGAGGTGGGGGGASLALVSVASAVTFTASILTTAQGGDGGAGGPGQVAQFPGSGFIEPVGSGLPNGANGGFGASGSGGAGGSAGISVGILYAGVLPIFNADTTIVAGPPGDAGAAGTLGLRASAARVSQPGNPGQVGYVDPQGSASYRLAP